MNAGSGGWAAVKAALEEGRGRSNRLQFKAVSELLEEHEAGPQDRPEVGEWLRSRLEGLRQTEMDLPAAPPAGTAPEA